MFPVKKLGILECLCGPLLLSETLVYALECCRSLSLQTVQSDQKVCCRQRWYLVVNEYDP